MSLRHAPLFSFEFFPPKTAQLEESLWRAVSELAVLRPSFVSVTYGAGGSTRERTHRIVKTIKRRTNLEVAAHLTTIQHSKAEVAEIASAYWKAGVRHIVALRGDPPRERHGGFAPYVPHADGYAYASDLVSGLKGIADFEISVAAFPEGHPDSASPDADVENLKRKLDAGATRAITQFFFDAETFLRFRDRCAASGIDALIVPGILPVVNCKTIEKFSAACGLQVPRWMPALFGGLETATARTTTHQLIAAILGARLCGRLQGEGVSSFHFYTLNQGALTSAICRILALQESPLFVRRPDRI